MKGAADATIGPSSRPRIVVSGVNLVDLGPLTIFRDALRRLVEVHGRTHEIVALVHRAELFQVANVTYLEYPLIKGSWLRRLRFEYFDCLKLSRKLRPALWVAMHDMTPRVQSKQVVYCHNPAPFYRFKLREAVLDPVFGGHTLLYGLLYRLFLRRNAAVIVQQEWIREAFRGRFKARNVIVARPAIEVKAVAGAAQPRPAGDPYRFFFPALSRTFKNHALLLEAVKRLEARGVNGFELVLTVDAASNRCGADLIHRYGHLRTVRWLGTVPHDQVYALYGVSDCLVFPSLLETWGLPITEFKTTGKPILAADLPYAHETVGTYDKVAFFDPDNADALAERMASALRGELKLQSVTAVPIAPPCAKDWDELWTMLVPEA